MHESEFLIVGAGIVGLTIAQALVDRGATKVTVIEKERGLGFHASGRNSGVLHAGIYYPPNTLKARLCLQGNLLMQDYCLKKGLPLIKSGKVIVARNASELTTLFSLYERAKENGASVELLDEAALAKLEPNAKTYQQALRSHYTAVVDNKAILNALHQDLIQSNRVQCLFGAKLLTLFDEFTAQTSVGK
ncbi:MAG: FAD dependent oxidoreductase, partial [uncultured bacterium]